jgi:cytochrome c-type biogenesis protein CcmE
MKAKHQRLTLALLALAAVIGAGVLALSALKDQASFFYAPSDVQRDGLPLHQAVRLGGMVAAESIKHLPDGISVHFIVTDGKASVPVTFSGIVPDLFRENSGVVAEGHFQPDGSFIATNLLAKHDANYHPPQLAGPMHKTESLEQ